MPYIKNPSFPDTDIREVTEEKKAEWIEAGWLPVAKKDEFKAAQVAPPLPPK